MYSQEQQSGAKKQASNARATAVHGSRVIPVIATARRAGLWAMSSGPGSPSAPMTLPPDVFAALVQGQMNPTSMAPQQMNANVFSNTTSQPATPMGFGGQAAHMGQGGLEQRHAHAPQPISQRLHECYPEPWSTGVKQLDQWLQQNMTDEAVFDQLAQLPRTERKQLVGATVSRQGNILNPTKYILGGLKKNLHRLWGRLAVKRLRLTWPMVCEVSHAHCGTKREAEIAEPGQMLTLYQESPGLHPSKPCRSRQACTTSATANS